jgi:type IV secretion system protein VirD4
MVIALGAGYAETCKSGSGGGSAETAGESQYGAAGSTSHLMQCTSKTYPVSFVVTDPKGDIVIDAGKLLQRSGYRIKIFNTINFKKSMHYNPFAYIHSEKDILKLVTTLISNTKGEQKGGDEFWTKAETLLYCALIGYIHYEAPAEEQNFSTLIEFINAMEVREDDEEFQNPVDLMFEELAQKNPNHFAVRQYAKYKLAAGKTAKSILVSCGARLAVFDIAEVRDVTAYDELELDTLGDQKTALFLIMSDTDDSFNFLISMCYTQLFNLLCEKADDVYGGRLPVHVRCLIDECANIGQIPKLEKLMATIRSREISACLVLQAQSQLKAIYKDNADTIIGNCDCSIFLGGKEPTTLKELSASLGKETIDTFNTGESRGREVSHSLNYQKLGKALMDVDELAVLDGGKCILQLRGVRPFLSDKFDITRHPNYKFLADCDKKNAFDLERFLSTKLKPKSTEVYDVYEVDVSEDADPADPE